MFAQKLAGKFLRVTGVLLVVLGVVHLAVTPHLPRLLDGMRSPELYRRAVGPTLLNHVLVGFLLLPLGYTTWLASAERNLREGWAKRILLVNTLALLTLPISIAVLMRQPEYYHAPLFVAGVSLVAVICVLVAGAAVVMLRGGPLE